ncbi:GPI transamidase component PIG-S-like [Liolophura sinensis]|uniref:GPI transamidase component PIG-S-like n=1 Tax=Liolophura sinensis TaxID=3198878 RepID=UPI0031597694
MPLKEEEKASQAYAALGVGFVCLIVGVPLWWKTTEVYRVQLPYNDIDELGHYKIRYSVRLDVISFDEKVTPTTLNSLTKHLQGMDVENENIVEKYEITVRKAIGDELTAFQKVNTLQDLDENIANLFRADMNHIHVLLLPKSTKFSVPNVYVGTYRNIILPVSDEKSLSDVIKMTVKDVVVRGNQLEKKLVSLRGLRSLKPDKESMRVAKSNPAYDVTFTLVNPQPDLLDIRWDIVFGIEAYLKPFIQELEKYARLHINSQVLYYTGLVRQPRRDKGNNCYYYTAADLPHIINPLETKLGSHVSTNPSLEFIVYIPYRDQSPLYIYKEKGGRSESNSFLSPQWGGIHIYNVPSPAPGTNLPAPVDINIKRVMEVFLSQLRLLLGVQSQTSGSGVASPGHRGITQWELDSWLRGRCLENLATSTVTLTSLAQLLGQISNIVIRDEIGKEVQISVESIRRTHQFLSLGDLEKAFFSSRQAIVSSEKAFFDPSLLELLYFPEDQKFAIYIPLFLPISIPVAMSILQAVKWYKNKSATSDQHIKKD